MQKADALTHWKALPAGLPILPHMTPIPYKASGSTYGACGIRIDGSPAFIDAVLSRLQDLTDGENTVTRLALARSPVEPREVGGKVRAYENAADKAECCYIRLHVRGNEGSHAAAYEPAKRAASDRYAAALGITG